MKNLISYIFLFSFCFLSSLYSINTECKRVTSDPVVYLSKSKSFEKFLSWTNEKQRIAQEVLKIVGNKKESLLDIGAGDGTITKMVSDKFNYVTAIEPANLLFEDLKKKCDSSKYTLIKSNFESTELNQKFDVILMSYSLQFIKNYSQEIFRLKDILKDSGLLIVVELDQENCELWGFHRKYRKEILETDLPDPVVLEYGDLLKKAFKVEKKLFNATLSVPSVNDMMSIFDFIYDTEISKMNPKTLERIRSELLAEHGNNPLDFTIKQVMYVCTK
jgi:ubiquinone/menaquinone biosynthesis C-methylase UbiE